MIIRDARATDAERIASYWNPLIRDTAVTFTTEGKQTDRLAGEITARQADGKAYIVAVDRGQVCGHATYAQYRSGPGYARTMEHTVILDPDVRGRGIGRALMTALEDHARKAGVHAMIAGVSGDNPGAIAFHEKIGYRHMATLPELGRKFDRWMDLVILQKLL